MKARRHQTILRLVRSHAVESQDQLQGLLGVEGVDVTQATLSRDLRSLGVVKVPRTDGRACYRATPKGPDRTLAVRNLQAFLGEMIASGNLLVVKTRVGGAQPVALALDQLMVPDLVGTVAGDDTVLGIVAEGAHSSQVIAAIEAIVDNRGADA
jgi:transcriptional regulator of arginine metabolism